MYFHSQSGIEIGLLHWPVSYSYQQIDGVQKSTTRKATINEPTKKNRTNLFQKPCDPEYFVFRGDWGVCKVVTREQSIVGPYRRGMGWGGITHI